MHSPPLLPVELVTQIVGCLDRQIDKTTILSCRHVNSQFRQIADTLMYCTIVDTSRQNTPHDGDLQHSTWEVVRNPNLAQYVKAICLRTWDFHGEDIQGRFEAVTNGRPTQKQWDRALDQANFPADLKAILQHNLHQASYPAHLCLLITVCPGLEVLRVTAGYRGLGELFHQVLDHVILVTSMSNHADPDSWKPLGGIMSSLTHLSFGHGMDVTGLSDVPPFLCLPNLRKLEIRDLADNRDWTDHNIPPLTSGSKYAQFSDRPISLLLDHCMLSGKGLGRLLSLCESRVQSLTVHWRTALWNEHLNGASVGDAIRQHGANLRFLKLNTISAYSERYRSRDGTNSNSFGSFESLTHLKHLAIPRHAFWNQTCQNGSRTEVDYDLAATLPTSLEELYLLGLDKDDIRSATLTNIKRGLRLPNLSEVIPVLWDDYSFMKWLEALH